MVNRLTIAIVSIVASVLSADAFAAFGRTAGSFDVSATGSAQYSIPLWVPPGVRGIQPTLALNYDSRLGYGIMGPGWTLSGLSAISRCNPTFAQDGTPAPITLTNADRLCLDGNRLRSTGTGIYQTEIANFSQVTAFGTAGNGPAYFTVQGKDGLTYEYGNTTDSKILPAAGVATPYIWALDKVTDRAGNHMTFTYYQANGSYVPLSIQYPGAGGNQINFFYSTKSANDTISKFIAGTQIQQTQQLSYLTATTLGGTAGRVYKLRYTTSSATLRATLTSIQECDASTSSDCLAPTCDANTSPHCLAPTVVGYQSGTAGVASPTTASGSGATNGTVYSVDIDGDGKQDLVFATTSGSNYLWWVQLATATGYGAPINTGVVTVGTTNLLLDDFDATAGTELLAPTGNIWTVYKYNGTNFTATPTNATVNPSGIYAVADVDGDGRPDLVYLLESAATLSVQLNTSSGSSVSFASPVATPMPAYCCGSLLRLYGDNQLPNSTVKHFDFDGDGRGDLILTENLPRQGNVAFTLLSRGTGPFVGGSRINGLTSLEAVKWNDDACTDIINGNNLILSQCDGTEAAYIILPATPSLALDWDGDGRTDVLANVSGAWQLIRSEGNTYAPMVPAGINVVGTGTYAVTDQNGDGLDDLVFANSTASNAIYYGLHNGPGVHSDLATSFTDGYGLAAKPTYVSIAQSNYTPSTDAHWPYVNYIGPMYVVSKAVLSDPTNAPSGTYNQTFTYSNAWLNLQGRGFTGFDGRTMVDSRNGVTLADAYQHFFPLSGFLKGRGLTDSSSNGISSTSINPDEFALDTTAYNERYFVGIGQVATQTFDITTHGFVATVATNYSHDTYGNVTATHTDIWDMVSPLYGGEHWYIDTANTYAPDTTHWCLGLPTNSTVTYSSMAPVRAAITRTVSFPLPDYANCRQNQKVVEPGNPTYQVTTDYGYDTLSGNFGNLVSQTVTGIGMPARKTTLGWDSHGQFLTSIQNPLLQTTTYGYDANNGTLISVLDANGVSTSWKYDNFARKFNELRPDGTSTTWAYNDCATAGCVNANNKMTVTQTVLNVGGSTQSVQNAYLDQLDRVLVTSSTMLNGAFDRNEVQYDKFGNVHKQALPCTFVGCATYWITNQYDILQRITESQRPTSATVSTLQTTLYTYAGLVTTVQDALFHNTTTTYHANGLLGRSQGQNGYYQNFSYDSAGSLLSVNDSASSTLFTATYDYGIAAFQRNATDMDLDVSTQSGQHRQYSYDALGEIVNWTDAKSQSFSVNYDALSRPRVRTEPDLTTTWTWGATAASHNIGQLQSVSAVSSAGTETESYTFDGYGRPSTKTIALSGDASYTYTATYNATTGLLDTLQYPVSTTAPQFKLQYTYANGILKSISDYNVPTTVFWTANTANPRGQITQETLGNGVVTNRAIDPVTGWVATVQSGVSGGAGLQNSGFLYDDLGGVLLRQDGNRGLTENFWYDSMHRLDHSTLTTATNGTVTNLQMHYDATGMGNIASRSDIAGGAAWTYDPVRKHAVTQAGSSAYTYAYDFNGNVQTRNGNSVGWTSYNYPSAVNSSGESVEFWYGPERQRWKTVYTGSTGTETTYHVDKLLEKVASGGTIDYRHYIFAGSAPVAIYSRTSAGANTLRYVLQDHQGSVASFVTDKTPGPVTNYVSESFSAFGNRRDATTWSGAPTSGDETKINNVSREGYTGESALGVSMGLNHLNGRVQDAITGRFLSPDPFVPDPGNTQSFNRYSYVNNNPLSLVDPSGFDDAPPCVDCGTITVTATPPSDNGGNGSNNGSPNSDGATPISSYGDSVFAAGLQGANLLQGFNLHSHANSIQLRNPGPDTVSTVNPDGTTSPLDPDDLLTLDPIQVTSPGYSWVSLSDCGVTYECGYNLSPLFRAATRIDMGRALTQFTSIGAGLPLISFRSAGAGIGAVYGGIGGYQAAGWKGVVPGVVIGGLTGAGGGALGEALAEKGVIGLWGVGATMLTGGTSAAVGAVGVNLLTGAPNLTTGVGTAFVIGLSAPLMSGEAMMVGGAGVTGVGSYVLNSISGGFGVAATAAFGP